MIYIKISSDISCDAIYYTTDGTDPTPESNLYTEPFPVYNDCEIRAIAVKDEWVDSEVSSLWVEVTVAVPEVVKKEGTASDNCFIEVINEEDYEGAENVRFYYTLDGTKPTEETTTSFPLGGSLNVTGNCLVRMIAGGEGNAPSLTTVDIKVSDLTCQTPIVSHFYDVTRRLERVTMSSPTKKAELYYTLDGTDPVAESYKYAGEFSIDHNCTLKVIALASDLLPSEIVESSVVVSLLSPTIRFEEASMLVRITNLSSFDQDSVLFYFTLDGTEPNTDSPVYNIETGIKVEEGQTVKVIAMNSSGVKSPSTSLVIPIESFTVIFDSEGGSAVDLQMVEKGKTAKKPKAPTKEGFVFEYWYQTGKKIPYDFGTPVYQNLVLHAKWKEETEVTE